MIGVLAIAGYRSLRDVLIAPARLTVVTGANGSGKSSLYRALRLLADVAQDRVVASLAQEGGLASALWAGPETPSAAARRGEQPVQGTLRRRPVRLRLGFAGEAGGYAIDLGLPSREPGSTAFLRDPVIKTETFWSGARPLPSTTLADRQGPRLRVRGEDGAWRTVTDALAETDSMMSHGGDPASTPELMELRERIRRWRFYDQWRTDRDAPARQPQVGTFTPVLAGDGQDLAAAVQTILEVGAAPALAAAVDDAFPGARLEVRVADGRFTLAMQQHGLLRVLDAAELSDGTLRYLMLTAALLSPRPPPLMVLNEPETSLHPDLLPALARLVGLASRRTQMLVVAHAPALVAALAALPGAASVVLRKTLGETAAESDAEVPPWRWPGR